MLDLAPLSVIGSHAFVLTIVVGIFYIAYQLTPGGHDE